MVGDLKVWWRRHRLESGFKAAGEAVETTERVGRRMLRLPEYRTELRRTWARQMLGVPTAELPGTARRLLKDDIIQAHASDPWLCNYLVNVWESVHGADVLSSYPWNVTIPIADVCNARCTFCTSWLEGTRVLGLNEIPRFAEVLRYARLLGIAGHGEPLVHPHCDEIFERIASYLDPRCESYIITNGVFLDKRREALRCLNITTYNVSLNAASEGTHDVVMGLGPDAFGAVIGSIRRLVEEGKKAQSGGRAPAVNISFVINRDNVHEIAEFVRLGNELGVDNIYLRTLATVSVPAPGLNYHLLPPYLHPEFERHVREAKEAIAESRARVNTDPASWSAPVLSRGLAELVQIQPPRVVERREALSDLAVREQYAAFYSDLIGTAERLGGPDWAADIFDDGTNPFRRQPPFNCYFVYQDFIVNDFNLRMIPCCYMTHVPGFEVVRFDGNRPFMEYWNSPAFVTLRRRLRQGPLYGACKKCPAQGSPS